jgi:hypothetical protein
MVQKMRGEFAKIASNKTRALEMKSRLNLMETKVKECQRMLEEAISALQDAEVSN